MTCRTAVAVALALAASAAAVGAQEQVLVSRQLAETEGLAIGGLVRLSSDADGRRAREFRVAGIYEPTPDPSRLGQVPREVRLHLPDLLDLTRSPGLPERLDGVPQGLPERLDGVPQGLPERPGGVPSNVPVGVEYVSAINVALQDGTDARAFAADVNARMPGISARPAAEAAGAAAPFQVLERFHQAIAVVTVVAATVFLLALTVMLVDERRETVGVLRLIGLPVQRILVQVLLEGLLVAAAGALFGLVLARLSQGAINAFFQWRYDTALVFVRITPEVAALCVAIAVPLGAAATVVASWALLRRNGLRLARR